MNKTTLLFSAALALLMSCNAASALDYKFSGTVTTVSAALASQFSLGETVNGTFSVTPSVPLNDHGGGPIFNFIANIGGDYPITATGGGFDILNDFGGVIDAVKLDTNTFSGLAAPPVAGHTAEYFSLNLLYGGTTHLTSPDFLPQFIFANPLDRSNLRFDGNDSLTVRFQLTDLSMIPEPSTMLLATTSIAALAGIRPRRGLRRANQ